MTDRVIRISVDPTSSNPQLKTLERNLKRVESASERVDRQNTVLGASFRQLGVIVAGVGIAQAGRSLLDTSARLQGINSRLAASTNDLGRAQQFLRDVSLETSRSYIGLADSYSKLLPLQKGGLITMQQLEKVTLGLANASTVLGVSQVDTNLALRGLTQIIGRGDGRTTAEDFNQLFDNLGGVLLEVEKASGLAAGGLRKLVLTNEGVSGIDILDKLVDGLEAFDGQAAKLSGNITQGLARNRRQYELFADQISAPLGSAVTPVLNASEAALKNLTDNVDEYIAGLKLVAAGTALAFGAKAASEITSFGKTQFNVLNSAIKRQEALIITQRTASEARAVESARVAKAAADESLAEASLAAQTAKSNVVRTAAIAEKRADALLSAELILLKREDALAEAQLTTAIAKTTQAEAARAVLRAEQGAISATTNDVRLKFAQSLEAASLAEAKASSSLVAATNAETTAKTQAASANTKVEIESRRLAQAKINEAKAVTSSVVAAKAEGVAYGQANTAKIAALTATNSLAAASTAATASTTRQVIALRAQAVAATASAAASRAAALAFGLMGGPVGVALIAAAGIVYLATKQSDAEKSSIALSKAIRDLNKDYQTNASAALSAANSTAEANEKTLDALRLKLAELKASQQGLDEGSLDFQIDQGRIEALSEEIDNLTGKINVLRGTSNILARGRELEKYYEDQEIAAASAARSISGNSVAIQEALDKILPNDKKRRDIEALRDELNKLFEGDTGNAKYIEANEALNAQLSALDDLTDAERKRADALDDVRDSFKGLSDTFISERQRLQNELISGNEIIDLNVRINPQFSEDDGESARVQLRERINEQLKELDDAELADRQAGLEKRRKIAQDAHDAAIAQERSNAEALKAARAVIDPAGAEEQRFAQELAALEAQNQFKLITNEDFQTRRTAKLINHLDSVASIEQDKSQTILDAAIASGVNREAAEKAHQDRLAEIERFGAEVGGLQALLSGETNLARRKEIHAEIEAAEQVHQERLAGIRTGFSLADRDTQISVGNQLLDLFEQRQNRKQQIATASARSLYQQAEEATGEEREQLLERAQIAEQEAKKRFESEKKSNLARARLAQALAVAQAWSTGVTIFDKIANAALVGLQTQNAIDSIQSTQFNGGSSLSSGVSASGSSSTDSSASTTTDSDQSGQNIQIVNLNGVLALDQDQVIAQTFKRLADDGYILDANLDNLNTQNISVQSVSAQ